MDNVYVIDTSVVIEGVISKLIINKEISGKILIPRAVLAELEHQANLGLEIGFLGLDELQKLQELKGKGVIELEFIGIRPNVYQIQYAKAGGEIDSMIRDLAYSENAILVTADKIQAESAKAVGLKVKFVELERPTEKLEIEKYFDDTTMSIHLKEDTFVAGKKGVPGNWQLVQISKKRLSALEVQHLAKQVVEKTRSDPKSFVEIARKGSTIVQYQNYRIVIVKPPVSDGWEITAVRPLKKLNLEDYHLPELILERLKTKARGIIVAGETGSGKSTFSSAVAEDYAAMNKIVKTVESPRDLILPDEITQYSKNFTTSQEIHDILFLSRPDNIIFDEVRDTPDFKLYTDLRLAGSNCLGVLHSASPIDAVQRFIGRLETGMIPSVLDTIIFIEKGAIGKVLTLRMTVKVPSGMTEADLARPVVEIVDFLTNKLEYEIYSYGEETVVIPVNASFEKISPAKTLAAKQIENEFRRYTDKATAKIISDHKAVVYIPKEDIARIIGKQGKTISEIEEKIGIGIDIEELKEEKTSSLDFKASHKGNFLLIYTKPETNVDIYINGQFLMTASSSKRGEIKIHKKSKSGKTIADALDSNKK
ncbi:Flp pilus assembly complex ATPase component TadA, partial [Candidatus Woesearchaeota archaeon]|nr:Flp pilus assembly complex ATPase component TadA [Candidatus Woesearchaeota archaeon]